VLIKKEKSYLKKEEASIREARIVCRRCSDECFYFFKF
jgi:hypothetical protein